MLIVPLRFGERLVLGDDVKMQFEKKISSDGVTKGKQVAVFIEAPKDVMIVREELKK